MYGRLMESKGTFPRKTSLRIFLLSIILTLSHYVSLKHLSLAHKNFIVSLNITIIPNTVYKSLTKREWKDAMRVEMSALEKNKTWEIVGRSKGKNIVDCK